jgi:hypothetical protein
MIKYLKHNRIDKKRWDDCISQSTNGLIYAYSWYLDIVAEKWDALVNDDYSAVMPLVFNSKFGINYLYPPFFTQQLGVFHKKENGKNLEEGFFKAIPDAFLYREINLNYLNRFLPADYEVTERINLELDLTPEYPDINSRYSQNTFRAIKKAEKENLKIVNDLHIKDIVEIFIANRSKGLIKFTKKLPVFIQLFMEADKRGFAEIHGALNKEGKLIAGAAFFISEGRAIFIFSGTTEEAKEKRAMFLLIDNFIRRNSSTNLILDFEGSNNEGIARFYKSFGAREKNYFHLKKNSLPALVKWIKSK